LKKSEKEKWVEEVQEIVQGTGFVALADYRGMNVGELVNLRREVKKAGGNLRVVKNTLFKRAISGTGFENLEPYMEGPTAAIYSAEDPIPVAKVITGWMKSQPKFTVRIGDIIIRPGETGRLLEANQLQSLANLPSRSILLGNLVAQLRSPLARFGQVLNSILFNIVAVLGAIKAQKESGGG